MQTTVQVLYLMSDFRSTCNIDKETLSIKLTTPTFSYEKYITDRFDAEIQKELWGELDLMMFRLLNEQKAKDYLFKKTMMDILYLICTFDNVYSVVNNYLKSNCLPPFVTVSADYENDGSLLF